MYEFLFTSSGNGEKIRLSGLVYSSVEWAWMFTQQVVCEQRVVILSLWIQDEVTKITWFYEKKEKKISV